MPSPTLPTSTVDHATAWLRLDAVPHLALAGPAPTPVEEMPRLRDLLRTSARLLVKRDDVLTFGAGGNKVRKLELLAARALADGADTLVTTGGIQSNHARATAAAAARLGLRCVLVQNGEPPTHPTGNALLVRMLGAEVEYVRSRDERAPRMAQVIDRLHGEGRRPFAIPLGASTALGALGYVRAIGELATQMPSPPDLIIHSSSSGGTQAGLVAGCALFGLKSRVIGVSADDTAAAIADVVSQILRGVSPLVDLTFDTRVDLNPDPSADLDVRAALDSDLDADDGPASGGSASDDPQVICVDDRFVDGGYGSVGERTQEALNVAARREGLLLDPVYSAKAMAALIAYGRDGQLDAHDTVLFWHTGGLPGLFA